MVGLKGTFAHIYIYKIYFIAQHLAKKTKDVRESVTQGPSNGHILMWHSALWPDRWMHLRHIHFVYWGHPILDPLTLHLLILCVRLADGDVIAQIIYVGVSINGGTLKSSTGNKIVPYKPSSYWGTPIYGNPHSFGWCSNQPLKLMVVSLNLGKKHIGKMREQFCFKYW